MLRLDLHKQTETNVLISIFSVREEEDTQDHFSGTTHCMAELREEPKNPNSSLAYPLHETMLPPTYTQNKKRSFKHTVTFAKVEARGVLLEFLFEQQHILQESKYWFQCF